MNLLKSFAYLSEPLKGHIFINKKSSNVQGRVIFWSDKKEEGLCSLLEKEVSSWQLKEFKKSKKPICELAGKDCPLWVLRPFLFETDQETVAHEGRLESSPFGKARDASGEWYRLVKKSDKNDVSFEFLKASESEIKGAVIGLLLSSYTFAEASESKTKHKVKLYISRAKGSISKELISEAQSWASGMNISRHLTNLPAGELNPNSFADVARFLFKNKSQVKVEVLEGTRLEKEKMGLLIGVGRAAEEKPRLVHIRYRPRGGVKTKPMAFVGKGVTFDTGGLDIKPSSGMRYMKKDMSGAGIVLGLAYYAHRSGLTRPLDFYLSLAENAVSEKATRPGDVLISRKGTSIEIHNTDAEGRLVLADALDYAITRKGADEPEKVIDVSTLTGAMRISLGLDVAGFFASDDKLAKDIEKASADVGEPSWRMPLYTKYKKQLRSSFADIANAGDVPFGSSISAALFLKEFVGNKKWAHFDVMAWSHSAYGALTEGGNAQSYQILAKLIS